MIDLSAMRAVRVDPAARLAWVQGGATWGDVDRETTALGLATPGGADLADGRRRADALRRHRLAARRARAVRRQPVAVDIVTADGQLLHASDDENADLFWAVRGGGGNFGVVTRFAFRLHPIASALMFCGPAYPEAPGARAAPALARLHGHRAGAAEQPRRVLDHPGRPGLPRGSARAAGARRSRPSTTDRPTRARRWWRRCARSARRSWISAAHAVPQSGPLRRDVPERPRPLLLEVALPAHTRRRRDRGHRRAWPSAPRR